MNLKLVIRLLGWMLVFEAVAMGAPALVAELAGDPSRTPLLASAAVTLAAGLAALLARRPTPGLGIREGILTVVLGWVVIPLFGALPFLISGVLPSLHAACFESVSGFTTTGASMIADVERVARPLLLWRSITHWLGGMGIVVLFLVILPTAGLGGARLYAIETSDVFERHLTPRIRQTARILLAVYGSLTVLEILGLRLAGMGWFDAVCHAFGTIATGGFSTRNGGIAAYHSLRIELVVVAFMFVSGLNFALLFAAVRGRPGPLLRREETRWYALLIVAAVLVATLDLRLHLHTSILPAAREALFQVVSINTTTGFASTDFNCWPAFSRFLLLLLMIVGACPGSTCGAIKNTRFVVLAKATRIQIRHLMNPRAVYALHLNGKVVDDDETTRIVIYVVVYLVTCLLATLGLTFLQVDIVSALSAVTATMGGVGPGLQQVGPMASYGGLPAAGSWLLIGCMLLGRLEIYAMVLVFSPRFWRA